MKKSVLVLLSLMLFFVINSFAYDTVSLNMDYGNIFLENKGKDCFELKNKKLCKYYSNEIKKTMIDYIIVNFLQRNNEVFKKDINIIEKANSIFLLDREDEYSKNNFVIFNSEEGSATYDLSADPDILKIYIEWKEELSSEYRNKTKKITPVFQHPGDSETGGSGTVIKTETKTSTTWGPTKTTSFKKKVTVNGSSEIGIPGISTGAEIKKEWYEECFVNQRFGEEKTIEIITYADGHKERNVISSKTIVEEGKAYGCHKI